MTIQGAIAELQNLLDASDVPFYYKGGIQKVIETMQMDLIETGKEQPRRVRWSGWKGYRDTRYFCPTCSKAVRKDDAYCHRCGQRLMFPRISFTPYVEGRKQELIVKWDDEETEEC